MLKRVLRRLYRRFGYEVLGSHRAYGVQKALRSMIEHEGINLVLDIGANEGQFVDELRALGYSGKVISFEPLSAAHARLKEKAAADPNWQVAERGALGATAGQLLMHLSANSMSSSLLPMLASHEEAAPGTAYVASEAVAVSQLDDLYHPAASDRILLKIDVQGYEKHVFDGALKVLQACRAVMVEMSLQPLYSGQALIQELWDDLAGQGFEPWWLEPGFRHPQNGRLLQLDGLFIRSRE